MKQSNDVKGIVEIYLCGEAVDEASADVLFGLVNPSGLDLKIIQTFLIFLDMKMKFIIKKVFL